MQYEQEDRDALLMITEQCNSDCIMCPMGPGARKRGNALSDEALDRLLDGISDEVEHIDITGGEPFLRWQQVLHAMEVINARWPHAEVLVLTNGRALSVGFIQQALTPLLTPRYRFAIPIHADTPQRHDEITRASGSFEQSMRGLRFLSGTPAQIEVRLVAHRLNADVLADTCRMLRRSGVRVDVLNLVAMEMNGSAARNRAALWMDYDRLYAAAEPGLMELITHGVDVGLYDFPLCALPERAWALAKKSITPWKVRYAQQCCECAVQEACGGLFRSTWQLDLCPVYPLRKEDA